MNDDNNTCNGETKAFEQGDKEEKLLHAIFEGSIKVDGWCGQYGSGLAQAEKHSLQQEEDQV